MPGVDGVTPWPREVNLLDRLEKLEQEYNYLRSIPKDEQDREGPRACAYFVASQIICLGQGFMSRGVLRATFLVIDILPLELRRPASGTVPRASFTPPGWLW